jgi:hypothetical protein
MTPATGGAAFDTLAGVITATPGGRLPNLHSTRQAWAPRLARGRPAAALPGLLSTVYTLCGGAHRLAATAAVAAALGRPALPGAAERQALQGDTLREHLRRLWLDWPRAMPWPGAPPDAVVLAAARCCAIRWRWPPAATA